MSLSPRLDDLTCPDGDPEYDVVCSADMVFESRLRFSVTTTLWVNWPRERFASLQVSLSLEVEEVVGKVRFGVEKGHSFFSFLEEPRTRLSVSSAMGSLNNSPLVSELVIMAIRKHIADKLVHPGQLTAHTSPPLTRFRETQVQAILAPVLVAARCPELGSRRR